MEKLLILLNENDEVTGYAPKIEVHKKGLLHRAFSVFIYDRSTKKMLLQKRSKSKYHSGGLWSNACCSHPYKDELWKDAIQRCMKDELGIVPSFREQFIEEINPFEYPPCTDSDRIQFVSKFHYCVNISDMTENEMDYVFLYHPDLDINSSISINPDEIDTTKWISLDELDFMLADDPDSFTAWFQKAYEIAKYGIKVEDSWDGYEKYGFFIENS